MKKNTFKRTRVVMSTIGSHGDLHPYIALALEMKKLRAIMRATPRRSMRLQLQGRTSSE